MSRLISSLLTAYTWVGKQYAYAYLTMHIPLKVCLFSVSWNDWLETLRLGATSIHGFHELEFRGFMKTSLLAVIGSYCQWEIEKIAQFRFQVTWNFSSMSVTAHCRNTSTIRSITKKVIAFTDLRNFRRGLKVTLLYQLWNLTPNFRSCGEQANYERGELSVCQISISESNI